ncbi:MAG: plasmid recombination protein [Burkholderiaceae bacterium]|nr:plasmid recombination protein [Burkholderiaceae bacterium]
MTEYGFLRAKSLNLSEGQNIIAIALKHNKREFSADFRSSRNIDSRRTYLNESLPGPRSAFEAERLALQMLRDAGITTQRKNASICVEFVFSLPANFKGGDKQYFLACIAWLEGYFGPPSRIISADVHRDQATPHCHVLMMPILGNTVSGRKMLGGKKQLKAMQEAFHDAVASKHGLSKPAPLLRGLAKAQAASAVIAHLKKTADAVLMSPTWPIVRAAIEANPRTYLDQLGVDARPVEVPQREVAAEDLRAWSKHLEQPAKTSSTVST